MLIDFHTHKIYAAESPIFAIRSLDISEIDNINEIGNYSVGLHPWHSTTRNFEENLLLLEKVLAQKNVLMLGECGLDALRGEPLPFQIMALEQQIQLAEKVGKPLVLHCVKAFNELIEIKKRLKPTVPMIVHGFNRSANIGNDLLKSGFLLSFGTALLNEKNDRLRAFFQKTPSESFFLETDNSDISIEKIYETALQLRHESCLIFNTNIF